MMKPSEKGRKSDNLGLRYTASLLAMVTVAVPSVAAAQDTTTNDNTVSEIVVTGTRVIRDGYQAPTPTSVIGAQELTAKAAANIADFVNELPSLSGSTSPRANVGSLSGGLIGVNALNLRNIGANRTLVLLDGQRVAASTLTGLVDINTLPQALVKRVDIVTGGASADWGSDAVSGVVNFVLDKDFTGLKGSIQGGVTTYGDDRNFNISLSAGTRFADGRGHVMISGEIAHNAGIKSIGDRKWFNSSKLFINPAYTPTNGQPQLLNLPGAGFATATPGGLITSGPLRGTYFGQGGTPTQFNYGSIVSGNIMVGGDYLYADFARSGDLDPKLNRQSLFGRTSYELTENVTIYGQASYSRATSRVASLNQFNFGAATVAAGATSTASSIIIQPDNAFIPASIAPRVTTAFALGTFNQDLGPAIATTRRSSQRYVLGLQGDLTALGKEWQWDAYAQRSVNNVYTDGLLTITSRFNQAIDAVRNPTTGAIVCRSTLTNPTNGCVPYNIMGTGVASEAARNYVLGTSWGRSKLKQDVFAGTLRGEPFSTWAGPVSLVTGIEHRRERVSGSNDPLSTTRSFFAGNFLASFGSYHVTEGFLETVVPLAKDLPFAESLDFNGAVRATDYSTSGYVTTWKAGLTWAPVSDITFRVTRSRDIRAPNLAELFQSGQSSTTSIVDPFRGNAATTVFQVTSGSTTLKPEKADSLGLGVVLKPSFIPGFAASVDYYNIKIEDAIQTVTAAALVNQCFLGNTQFCSQITRNTAGVITSVAVKPVNVARQKSRGIDFEASYRRPVAGGDVRLRVLATRFIENTTNDGITPAVDTVGTNGTNGTARNTLPKWRYLASIGYDYDPVSISLTGRGFSSGVYNTTYVECTSGCPTSTAANMTINNNRLPGALYFDTNVTVKLPHDIEVFLAVDNIANKDPAQMAFGTGIGSAPLSINPLLYDVLGRTFRAGARFKL
ncbi:TonB-dependent receptor plug domain-containing protein [Sphingomonas crocodyli]|nr:TonB-dependent receptor [Sphingomonas crocodyli]